LARYQDGVWTTYNKETGELPSNGVTCLLESRDSSIWVGTNEGLARTTIIGMVPLLMDKLIYINVMVEDSNDTIWVGTQKDGLMRFSNNPPPSVQIVKGPIRLDGTESPDGRIGVASTQFYYEGRDLQTLQEDLRYSYRIDDEQWSRPNEEKRLALPPLTEGKHTFYVVALDDEANVSDMATREFFVNLDQPLVLITSPVQNDSVCGEVDIEGVVKDADLLEYRVEYAQTDESPTDGQLIWKANQEVDRAWLATWDTGSLPTGQYTIRLVAEDTLKHEREYRVDVQVVSAKGNILARQGGHIVDTEERVEIYMPPNALERDMEVTVALVEDSKMVVCADIEPAETILRKPATLTFRYEDESVQNMDESKLAVFYLNGTERQRIGGTVDAEANKITTVITSFGRYAVKVDGTVPDGKPGIFDVNCQPRVFSSKRGETHISFRLGNETGVSIKVYNLDGKLRRILTKDKWMSQGMQVLSWNGRNEAGEILPSGLYFIAIIIEKQTEIKTVVIQNR